jgi:hypothetical protein
VLAGATESLIDLQSVDACLGCTGEYRPVDHVLSIPIMLIRNNFTSQELMNG